MTSPATFPISRRLKNGVTIAIHDQSRRMAGDRWLVIIRCEAEIPVRKEFWQRIDLLDAEMSARIRQQIGPTLCHIAEQKRYFTNEADLPEVVATLLKRIESTMVPYFEGSTFPEKLFAKRVSQCRDQLLNKPQNPPTNNPEKEDKGPADFSHCFKN